MLDWYCDSTYVQGSTEVPQQILKEHKIKTFYKTTNTLRNALVKITDKTPFVFIQNFVYRLGYIDFDALFYIGEFSREISTDVKEYLSYTKRPHNNPIELEILQVKSAITVHATLKKSSNRY
ncbi:hypothetical protein MS3_00000363 [Schistosoma haematobium]|uniref:Uncharacterized protein n=1 Tax=Schistosoma haematobium TaxID=6185 RepID=A0A922ILG4_SCHHA|nr:hypothetical protein MS3_00000363 [Schistosoma haematobium]KAH9582428.1 hypothetical protein MS3_00000363 [Schistosoma haematobium]